MISKSWEKLREPEYRKAFVEAQLSVNLPFQIRALLKERGWTQEDLAKKTGMLQPRISGLLSPGRTRPNIETLRRLASAFDCAVAVRFVPFSELLRWSDGFDPETFSVPSFTAQDAGGRRPATSDYRKAAQLATGTDGRTESSTGTASSGRLLQICDQRPSRAHLLPPVSETGANAKTSHLGDHHERNRR